MHPWNQGIFDSLRSRTARLPHALLLHGARGTGKLALAEHIAQFLLCEAGDPGGKPCGACDGCRWFAAGSHPDFRRLEPEALAPEPIEPEEGEPGAKRGKPSIEIKIEQVRELAAFLNVGSHRGRFRVALVHPAEDMNANAANALLKGLEEPPAGAVFLLVSHRPARLLPTIRSRCVALPVSIPPRETALQWLLGQGVKDAARWLAYAGGAPLLALDYAARADVLDRLLKQPAPATDRDQVGTLAEALQKQALDRAFSAFGLTPKYQTGVPATDKRHARAWLAFAREMGRHRLLSRHPLNPKLFSAQMLQERPET
ncbi:MAG: DNA polymerase III subunit delta' [Betaproteobacteria bacterium]|nr:MAG: DNA polymerase III subunit delta' [Betaproteobacteria bacterium]